MRLVAVCVGRARIRTWGERTLTTAFGKEPVPGPRRVLRLGVEGDEQADRVHHGGEHKAVLAFAREHRTHFANLLGQEELGDGAFGENLCTEGLLETEARIGDRLRIGGCLLEVSQPRQPCHKMAFVHQRDDLPHLYRRSGRSGLYLRVQEEGSVEAGQEIHLESRGDPLLTVHRIFALCFGRSFDPELATRALADPGLGPDPRQLLARRLESGV